MSDMTRHDIYGHEVAALKHYLNQAFRAANTGELNLALTAAIGLLHKVEGTDAGPMPRGEEITKEHVVAATFQLLKEKYSPNQHIEVRALDRSTIQMFVRPKTGVVYDFVIKITQPR
jgi:predicted HD phosphohydrolase